MPHDAAGDAPERVRLDAKHVAFVREFERVARERVRVVHEFHFGTELRRQAGEVLMGRMGWAQIRLVHDQVRR